MKTVAINTHKITSADSNILAILDKYISRINNQGILVVASKIVSICEGRMIKVEEVDKNTLIKKESDFYLSEKESKMGFILTIKNNILIPSAGIDESNGAGYYILWPKSPQKTANVIKNYLKKRFKLKKVGVIVVDSKTTPLRWGTTGVCLAYSGFYGLNDYIGKPDIFGRLLKVTKVNVADALASSAVLVMGEGNEQTPLALISDVPFVHFNSRSPSKKELNDFTIAMKDDLYEPLLTSVKWHKKLHDKR